MELVAILENKHIINLPNIKSTFIKDNGITIVYNMENEVYASFPANTAIVLGEDLTALKQSIRDIQENQGILTKEGFDFVRTFLGKNKTP